MPAEEHLQYVPESSAVSLRVAAGAAIAAVVLLALAIGVFDAVYQAGVPVKTVPSPQTFPAPQVVTRSADAEQLHRLNSEQSKRLSDWRWVDPQHTLMQVPIDRAMQLMVQKGNDAWAPLEAAQSALASPTAGAERTITPDGSPQNSAMQPPNSAKASQDAGSPQEKAQ